MSIFPSNPTIGDEYSGYRWDGEAWKVIGLDLNVDYATYDDPRLSDTRVPTDNSVTSAKISDGSIVNADISASAAIDQSKVSGLSTALSGKVGSSDSSITNIVTMTQAEYDAITPISTTLYVIVG